MFEATLEARTRAVDGEGPTLIEAVTMRMHGHAAHDDMKYVPREQVEEWKLRDPIDRQEKRLRSAGVDVDAVRVAVNEEIEAAVVEALSGPMPAADDVLDGVFCTGDPEPLGDGRAPWSGYAVREGDA
jgi:pyruvate dehydrogenase E1 component alpha subunit